eukprot:4608871-Prymnesium_polylepis.1
MLVSQRALTAPRSRRYCIHHVLRTARFGRVRHKFVIGRTRHPQSHADRWHAVGPAPMAANITSLREQDGPCPFCSSQVAASLRRSHVQDCLDRASWECAKVDPAVLTRNNQAPRRASNKCVLAPALVPVPVTPIPSRPTVCVRSCVQVRVETTGSVMLDAEHGTPFSIILDVELLKVRARVHTRGELDVRSRARASSSVSHSCHVHALPGTRAGSRHLPPVRSDTPPSLARHGARPAT